MARTPTYDEIIHMAVARGFWNSGTTVAQIAIMANVSASTVRRWLKATGLTTLKRRKQA